MGRHGRLVITAAHPGVPGPLCELRRGLYLEKQDSVRQPSLGTMDAGLGTAGLASASLSLMGTLDPEQLHAQLT